MQTESEILHRVLYLIRLRDRYWYLRGLSKRLGGISPSEREELADLKAVIAHLRS